MQLSAQSVDLRYGNHVVIELFSHTFKPGAWTHIIGPNGAGKSTLIKALCGLQPIAAGQILLNNRPVETWTPLELAKAVAYVPQQIEALPPIRAYMLVANGLFSASLTSQQACARALQIMQKLNIAHLCDRWIFELSGGELQLCVLAAAIAQNAHILLLDEPTKGLDLRYQQMLMQILSDLRQEGYTIISVTHDLSMARYYADQTILLAEHRCLFQSDGFPSSQQLGKAWQVCDFEPPQMPVIQLSHLPAEEREQREQWQIPSNRFIRLFLVAVAVTLVCLGVCPFLGATDAGPGDYIFWMLRIPRVIWGAVAGGVLAGVGAVFQSLFQNPLATPYTLGVASGASLGAMAAIQSGIAGIAGLSLSACSGGILTMLAVIAISSRYGLRQPFFCLMVGVAASMFCGALGMIVQSFATPLTAQQMMRWQLGGFEIVGYHSLFNLIPIAVGMMVLFRLAHSLNLISVDYELAATQGVRVIQTRWISIAAASVITSIVVSVCGPIGFVGLLVPNAIKHVIGADLRLLLPLSALFGASFLMIADMIARICERVAWIPAGVVTAVIGVPCFIYLLYKSMKK